MAHPYERLTELAVESSSGCLGSKKEGDAPDEVGSMNGFSRANVILSNLPYAAMIALGAVVLWPASQRSSWGSVAAVAYILYGLLGALWIMLFICPYCGFHGTAQCPCGYGQVAARLRARRATNDFARMFRRRIFFIVPLWFIPLVAGVAAAVGSFSWTRVGLMAAFAVDAFLVLPLASRKHGCGHCPQRDSCPWMAGKVTTSPSLLPRSESLPIACPADRCQGEPVGEKAVAP